MSPMLHALMLKDWLKYALKKSGISQAELTRQLNERLPQNFYTSTISNMVKGDRKISAAELMAIEQITGVPAPNSAGLHMVPVVGKVTAGAKMTIQEDAQGPFDEVEAPAGAPTTTVAALVDGDCIGPWFNGWLVFWDSEPRLPEPNMFNRPCVVGLEDGRIMLKMMSPGSYPGVYTLHSQFEPPIYDVKIKWAAPVASMQPY